MRNFYLKVIFILLGFLLILDLLFLNWKIFSKKEISTSKTSKDFPFVTISSSPSAILSCPLSCLEEIYQATTSLKKKEEDFLKETPTPKPSPTLNPVVKELYIPLGSGSLATSDWTDLSGVEAYIDPANYGKIKSITFEAILRIPSGNGTAFARLYNVNDKIGIFESEVSTQSMKGSRVESSKINLPSGNKLYRVQIKNSLGAESFLDLGRIKIILE